MAPVEGPVLSIAIVLVPDFTMLAFAALVDTLRLAGDERDRSRPIRCRWHVMSIDGRSVQSSSGVAVAPASGLNDPTGFDYVAVVGGTLYREHELAPLDAYLRRAAGMGVPLIGVCTGSFHLARAGLMRGRRACVTWLHRDEFLADFPDVQVVTDALFVLDRDRITCAGGTGVIHLASHLVDRHLGSGAAAKGLRIMLEERARSGEAPQPSPVLPELEGIRDSRVRRAVLLVEQSMTSTLRVAEIAARVGVSSRQLNRLFDAEIGCSVAELRQRLRLEEARLMVVEHRHSLTEIAASCGFADAAHFSRAFRQRFSLSPGALRRQTDNA